MGAEKHDYILFLTPFLIPLVVGIRPPPENRFLERLSDGSEFLIFIES